MIPAVDEDAQWLKAIDWHLGHGYKPVLVVFDDSAGDVTFRSIFGDEEGRILSLLANIEIEGTDPEPDQ